MFFLKRKMLWMAKQREIKKVCQSLLKNKTELVLTKDGTRLYRAKVGVKNQEIYGGLSKIFPLDENELWACSRRQGRFNKKGIDYPYLGFDELTTVAETRPTFLSEITIGVYALLKDLRVFDATRPIPSISFTITPYEFITSLSASSHSESGLIYDACNLYGEILRKEGFEGIMWSSSRRYDGKCLVIFKDKKQPLLKRIKEILNTVEIYTGKVLNCKCNCCISNFDFIKHPGQHN